MSKLNAVGTVLFGALIAMTGVYFMREIAGQTTHRTAVYGRPFETESPLAELNRLCARR